jgi:hypothetical protein
MEIEIHLEMEQVAQEDYPVVTQRLKDWHNEGAEIRYDKECFGQITELDKPFSYRVDLGSVDPIDAIRELHARIYRFGAKVYIHFVPV